VIDGACSRGAGCSHRRTRLRAIAAVVAAGAAVAAASPAGAASAVPRTQELVTLLAPHVARAAPARDAAARLRLPARAPITRAPTVLPVLGHRDGWALVQLPGRPNGRRGWIAPAQTQTGSTAWHLVVGLDARRVTAYRAGRRVRTFPAIVGAVATPTPRGRFFVEESIALRATDVGAPFALALSARSTVLQEFAGGPGQIALHGLDNVGGTLGQALSHGCVRVSDRAIRWLAGRIGPGVPVTVDR
jgi:lipoprotein-anchoring transpeptidase ErfK/SrfK